MAVFASKGRLFHSIDALYLKLRFKKLVFGFGSARSISWFRKLYRLLRSLSLTSVTLKHGHRMLRNAFVAYYIYYNEQAANKQKHLDYKNSTRRMSVQHAKLLRPLFNFFIKSNFIPRITQTSWAALISCYFRERSLSICHGEEGYLREIQNKGPAADTNHTC